MSLERPFQKLLIHIFSFFLGRYAIDGFSVKKTPDGNRVKPLVALNVFRVRLGGTTHHSRAQSYQDGDVAMSLPRPHFMSPRPHSEGLVHSNADGVQN